MARTPVAGGGSSISPFRGGGGSFGAFNIGVPSGASAPPPAKPLSYTEMLASQQSDVSQSASRAAYLRLQMAESDYSAGRLDDGGYRAAMQGYLATMDAASSEAINLRQRIETFDRTVERNKLVFAINEGTRPLEDLLAFDKQSLAGLTPDSQEYRDRVGTYEQTQAAVFSKQEKMVVDAYNAGKSTAAQLRDWYENALGSYVDNQDITDRVTAQIVTLDKQVEQARDDDMVAKWRNGTISPADFITYAGAVRDRFVVGSDQRTKWEGLIAEANDGAKETILTNRYDLTLRIAALQDAIATGSSLTGRKGTKRTIIDANGNAVTVTENTGPSAAQQAAYATHQADLANARKELAILQARLDYFGGPVSSATMIAYYTKLQGGVVKGTPQWFAYQSKIDTVTEQAAKMEVTAGQRVRAGAVGAGSGGGAAVSGPAVPANAPAPNVSDFLAVYGSRVSGGNHSAVSPTAGRFGKYQFTASQWTTYAAKYMGDPNAPMTPDNQEHVAAQLASDLFKQYGDWGRVAAVMNPSGGAQFANGVQGALGIAVTRKTAGINVTGAPIGKIGLLTVTGSRAKAITEEGPIRVGERTGAPRALNAYTYATQPLVGMDKAAYEKFYTAAKTAFRNGELSFSFISGGKEVTYTFPNDPGQRAAYMATLDNKRIELRRQDTITYADTKAGITKSASMQTAINDAAANQYIALDLSQGVKGNRTFGGEPLGTPLPSAVNWSRQPDGSILPTTNPNAPIEAETPLALASSYAAMQKDYIDLQAKLAKQALDKNDFNGAWAHMQLATTAYTQTQAYMTHLSGLAQKRMDEIARATGETTIPDKIKTDLTFVQGGWDADFKQTMTELDTKVGVPLIGNKDGTVRGNLVTEGAGDARRPKYNGDGSVSLQPDLTVVFDPNGKGTVTPIEKPGFNDAGTGLRTDMPGMVPVRVNTGASVVDGWVKYTENVKVGEARTTDGALLPLYGKAASLTIDGQRYSIFENPLAPGTFISLPGENPRPPVYTTPSSFMQTSIVAKDGTVTGTGYQWQAGGQTYRMVQDPASSQYVVAIADGLSPGGWSTYDPGKDKNVQADLVKAGWGLDINSVPATSRLAALTGHGWIGDFSPTDIARLTPEVAPVLQAAQAVVDRVNAGWRALVSPSSPVPNAADASATIGSQRPGAGRPMGVSPGRRDDAGAPTIGLGRADDANAPAPKLTAAQPTTIGPLPTILPPKPATLSPAQRAASPAAANDARHAAPAVIKPLKPPPTVKKKPKVATAAGVNQIRAS